MDQPGKPHAMFLHRGVQVAWGPGIIGLCLSDTQVVPTSQPTLHPGCGSPHGSLPGSKWFHETQVHNESTKLCCSSPPLAHFGLTSNMIVTTEADGFMTDWEWVYLSRRTISQGSTKTQHPQQLTPTVM